MGWAAFLVLDAIGAIVWLWPVWIALLIVQGAFLYMDVGMHRWLPLGLMLVGLLWVFGVPLVTQLVEGWRG